MIADPHAPPSFDACLRAAREADAATLLAWADSGYSWTTDSHPLWQALCDAHGAPRESVLASAKALSRMAPPPDSADLRHALLRRADDVADFYETLGAAPTPECAIFCLSHSPWGFGKSPDERLMRWLGSGLIDLFASDMHAKPPAVAHWALEFSKTVACSSPEHAPMAFESFRRALAGSQHWIAAMELAGNLFQNPPATSSIWAPKDTQENRCLYMATSLRDIAMARGLDPNQASDIHALVSWLQKEILTHDTPQAEHHDHREIRL